APDAHGLDPARTPGRAEGRDRPRARHEGLAAARPRQGQADHPRHLPARRSGRGPSPHGKQRPHRQDRAHGGVTAPREEETMFDFGGKVLLLTGANGGITRAIARLFHGLGARMVLTDLNDAGLKAFGAELDGTGKRVATLKGDATRSADSDAAVKLAQD